MLEELIKGVNVESEIQDALYEIHTKGPSSPVIFEKLATLRMFHAEAFSKHERKIISTMGLFYKTDKPNSVLEEVYSIFSDTIKINTRQKFTPVQASAYTEIQTCHIFSFSAPTSAGKSFLFRELIKETCGDIVTSSSIR